MQQERMLTYRPKVQITLIHLHIHLKGQFSVAGSPNSALLITFHSLSLEKALVVVEKAGK